MPGITTAMLVELGENGVKTVEDLAGCATDDLAGWTERKDGETKHEAGFLDGFELSREECEAMIMQARLKAGWVTEADLAPPATEEAAGRSGRARAVRRGRDDTAMLARADTERPTAGRAKAVAARSGCAR